VADPQAKMSRVEISRTRRSNNRKRKGADMASAKQIAANRANAMRRCGPKTAAGRLKSSRNAFRHGLSGPLRSDPVNLG
jgi:hypothetical protein